MIGPVQAPSTLAPRGASSSPDEGPAATAVAPAPAEPVSGDAADRGRIERLRALLTDSSTRVSMHQDDRSGRMVMQVQDRESGEVVEQIPSDELLRLFAAMRQPLVDRRA